MHQFYSVLKNCTLFNNFNDNELSTALSRYNAHIKLYKNNETIRSPHQLVTEIGIVVKGFVYISKTDYNGNRVILSEVGTKNTFGEALALAKADNSPIEIISKNEVAIIFIKINSFTIFPHDEIDNKIQNNLIKLLAEKNLLLQIKNDILSQKTTREKLMIYFEYEAKTAGSKSFRIHFNREELADFLCINSSAMSRELGRMRDEGILTFRKNRFYIK